MKNKLFHSSLILLLFLFNHYTFAQSDYQIMQEFKSKHKSFDIAIDYAKNLKELNNIRTEIDHFKEEFSSNKNLLDKALYPDDFNSALNKLYSKLERAEKRLARISGLEQKVTKLKTDVSTMAKELEKLSRQIAELKSENKQLLSQILRLKRKPEKDAKTIDSLIAMVKTLQAGIAKRDSLLKDVMDNIFLTDQKLKSLNQAEKKELSSKIQGTNLIENIEFFIADNIELLNAGVFKPEDLLSLKEENKKFKLRWEYFGPKLADIYASDEAERQQIKTVDSLISVWDSTIVSTYWRSVDEIFRSYNIELKPFRNGNGFFNSAMVFIDKFLDTKNDIKPIERHQKFVYFQTVWNDEFSKKWLPVLLKENLFTELQKKEIESKLELWGKTTGKTTSIMIYVYAVILIILILVVFYFFYKNKNKSKFKEETVSNSGENPAGNFTEDAGQNTEDRTS